MLFHSIQFNSILFYPTLFYFSNISNRTQAQPQPQTHTLNHKE
jgi:hypothetical protein